jgi:hypothetical protein
MDDAKKLQEAKDREEAELAQSRAHEADQLERSKAAHKGAEKPVSLDPLSFEEALKGLLSVKPAPSSDEEPDR